MHSEQSAENQRKRDQFASDLRSRMFGFEFRHDDYDDYNCKKKAHIWACRLQVLVDQLDKKRHNKIIPLRFVSQTLVPNGQPVLIILLSPKGTNVNTIAIMSQLMST